MISIKETPYTVESYMGYAINYNIYGQNEYSVLFGGKDMIFESLFETRNFVDRMLEEKRDFFKKIIEYNNYLCKGVR